MIKRILKEPKETTGTQKKRTKKDPKGQKRTSIEKRTPKDPKGPKRTQKEPKGTKRNQKD